MMAIYDGGDDSGCDNGDDEDDGDGSGCDDGDG
jgi:hypothetical protein